MKSIFIFSTPEGGGEETAKFLETKGFKTVGGVDNWPDIAKPIEYFESLKGQEFVPEIAEKLYASIFFEDYEHENKFIYLDLYTGWGFGWAYKIWVWLLNNMPDVKFIFCNKGEVKTIASVAANIGKWKPHFCSCVNNAEQKIKSQISQQTEFLSFYNDIVLHISDLEQQRDELLSFINE